MTRQLSVFQRALLGSFFLHLLFVAALLLVPGGGPDTSVSIYTVRILEAPSRPEARGLNLSTEAISSLNLESPSLTPEAAAPAPDGPPAAAQEVTELPPPPAWESAQAAPPAPSAPVVAAVPLPAVPGQPAAPSATAAAPPTAPRIEPGAPPAPALGMAEPPALPELPRPSGQPQSPPPGQAPAKVPAAPPAPPAPAGSQAPALTVPPTASGGDKLMEKLREKVRSIDLQVNSSPTQPAQQAPSAAVPVPPDTDRSLLALRIFQNRAREAVKANYTFPGGFASTLVARVRVILERSGKPRQIKIMESSGNPRFDNLVCLAAINKAEFPPLPSEIEGDTLTLNFTCTP